ncbi:MAG: DUF3096 domain-containing protein [Nanoarchaeota archaeon]|nr:DUF3096 domain-containing protein [Nanoarchaeota archaeon]
MVAFTISAILAIIFGVLILLFPKSLNYFVALYLILSGLISIFG